MDKRMKEISNYEKHLDFIRWLRIGEGSKYDMGKIVHNEDDERSFKLAIEIDRKIKQDLIDDYER